MGDVFQSADRKNYAFFEEIQDERVYMEGTMTMEWTDLLQTFIQRSFLFLRTQ